MSKKKKKYYTVWKGHKTGVFERWDDCKAQIKDFKGAQNCSEADKCCFCGADETITFAAQ